MLKLPQRQTPYIHVFKLSTTEEIIAKVTEETIGNYTITQPLQMVMGPKGPQFAPFMMLVNPEKSMNLNKSLVLADAPPMPELENQYESITTGIALPQKNSIIT